MGTGVSPDPLPALDEQELLLLANGVRIIALRSLGEPDAAQDVAQETLARTVRALAEGRLRDRAAIGGFVRSIARHVIADELRRRAHVVPLDPDAEPPGDDADPLHALVRAEEVAAVRAAMTRLSPTDRRVIHLSYMEGLTPAAVAERLHEPPARVRKRKSRAIERLRLALRALRPEPEAVAPPVVAADAPAPHVYRATDET